MGTGEDWFDDHLWEDSLAEEFYEEFRRRTEKLSLKKDAEILYIAVKCGPKLNNVTEYFPAYEVALKLRNNNWTPTEEQRKAVINVTAFYQTSKRFQKRYDAFYE